MQHPGHGPQPSYQPAYQPTANPYGTNAPPGQQPYGSYPPAPTAQQPSRNGPPGTYMGHQLAGWGARVGASLLDSLVPLVPMLIGLIIAAVTGQLSAPAAPPPPPDLSGLELTPGGELTGELSGSGVYGTTPTATAVGFSPFSSVVLVVAYLAAIGLSFYNTVFRQGKTGQSWGKQVLKLKLVTTRDGRPLGAGMTFVRGLCHFVDQLPFPPVSIGYLFPLWDPMRQTFADKICSTIVLANVPAANR